MLSAYFPSGCFDHEEEAARAYDKMMLWCELHNTAGIKGGITNFDPSEHEKEIPWLQGISQVCVRACVRACLCACVRACIHVVCLRACVCVRMFTCMCVRRHVHIINFCRTIYT